MVKLRHVLRGLHRFSLFSLFLSTTGKISQFTSAPEEDVSKRILAGELFLIQPFTDLGFDMLAEKVSVADLRLKTFICDLHIVHIGRPLYVLPSCPFGGIQVTDTGRFKIRIPL
jgi:hypothetical protein